MIGGGVLAAVILAIVAFLLWPSGGSTPLTIHTDPAGADVFLDGEQLGRTPLEDLLVAAEGGRLRIQRVGYAPVDTLVAFAEGEPFDLRLPLVALAPGEVPAAVLAVTSTPSGATVLINGDPVGATPYTHRDSTGRPLLVSVEREGYERWVRRGVLLEPGVATPLHADLQREAAASRPVETPAETRPPPTTPAEPPTAALGTLTLSANPGGTVSVAGQSSRNSGTFSLPAGTHTIRCVSDQYGSFEASVRVRAGQTETATCHFRTRVNVVATTAEGNATWGAIWLDGVNTGETTPGQLELGPGTHRIMVRRDGYQTLGPEQTFSIEPGLEPRTARAVFQLQRQ